MMAEQTKRIAWVDIAKGMAMIAVMADHCGIALPPLVDYFEVPAFFILSGMMMKEVKDYWQFAYKKGKRLVTPYIIYNVLFIAIFLICGWRSAGLAAIIKNSAWAMIVSANYPLWFLKALLWGFLLAGACSRFGLFKDACARCATLCLLFAAGIGTGCIQWGELALASCLPQGIIAAPLLALGFCFKGAIAEAMSKLGAWRCLAWGIAASVAGWLMMHGNIGFNRAFIGNAGLFYPFVGVSFAAGVLLSRAIARFAFPIEYVGRNSMRYFCLHAFAIKFAQGWGWHQPWLVLAFTIAATTIVAIAIEKAKTITLLRRKS